jgi:Cof subfamily protein (haloacid dehalogenase superfamily)
VAGQRVRAVFLDVDGTLLRGDLTLSARVATAVQHCSASGVSIILASGRPFSSLERACGELPAAYLIGFGGAGIVNRRTSMVTLLSEVPTKAREFALQLTEAGRCACMLYTVEARYGVGRKDYLDIENGRSGLAPNAILSVDAATKMQNVGPFLKIMLVASADEARVLAADASTALTGAAEVTTTYPEYVELVGLGVSKGKAARIILDEIGIDPSATMAIGDGMNDVALLASAGVAVCVSNAVAQARELCQFQVPSNKDDGVAVALEGLVLGSNLSLALCDRLR